MMSTYESYSQSEDDRSEAESGCGVLFQKIVFGRYYPHLKKQLMCSVASIYAEVAVALRLSWHPTLHEQARRRLLYYFDPIHGKYKLDIDLPDIRYFTVGGGVLMSCLAIEYAGSPLTISFSNAIMLLGWVILATWSNDNVYLVSYAILELGSICNLNSNIVYMTEIVDPGLRGFFGALLVAAYSLGSAAAQFVTANERGHNWGISIVLCILFCCLSMMFSFAIPESPIRLLLSGKHQSARTVFFWLHDETPNDEMKYQDLVKMAHKHNMNRGYDTVDYMVDVIFSPKFFKPLVLVVLICTVYVGILYEPVVTYFSYKMFDRRYQFIQVPGDDRAFEMIVLANVTRLAVSLLVSLLIQRLRRRTIFLASALCSGYGLMVLIIAAQYSFTATTTTVVFGSYVLFASLGVLLVPFIVMAEYFPQPVRQFGSGLALIFINYAELHTVADKRFDENIERDPVERNALYWICCFVVLISTIVLFVIMPETEGLSLSQLEDVVVRGPWIPRKGDALPTEGIPAPKVATPVDVEITGNESRKDGKRAVSTTTNEPRTESEYTDSESL